MSCDLLPTEAPGPHYQGDVRDVLDYPWDLMIAHPCTHLSVSGAKHFAAKRLDGRQQSAVSFFMALARAPIPRIAIENPVHHVQHVAQAGSSHPAVAVRARRNEGNVPVVERATAAAADRRCGRTGKQDSPDAAQRGSLEREEPHVPGHCRWMAMQWGARQELFAA